MSSDIQDQGRRIRSATEEDFDRVLDIDRHSFSAPWIHNFFKSALKDIFLVLEKKREIAGYLIACVCHDLEKAVIIRCAVHPDHRGEGIAQELIRRCLDKIANIIVFPSDTPGDEETFYIMRLELPKSEERATG